MDSNSDMALRRPVTGAFPPFRQSAEESVRLRRHCFMPPSGPECRSFNGAGILYWIPLYGQAPSGITGLDATVDTDVGLDLKFKNTTNNWMAVVASADGTTVRFALWGTDPGWTVNVDDPVVSNVVKADTTMQYEQSDQLPSGTTCSSSMLRMDSTLWFIGRFSIRTERSSMT